MEKNKAKIVVTKNGPYVVTGRLPLAKEIMVLGKDGYPARWKKGKNYPAKECYSLCRCGHSLNHPYCDGNHVNTGFKGRETASREEYLKHAKKITGPNLVLTDNVNLCASARFCDRAEGVWQATKNSGRPKAKETAIQEACDCPSGRLVVWDRKTGKQIEPDFKPSLSIAEDPGAKVSGPIWVKGGVPIESENGAKYEIRNRVTLCRCGHSTNKPFCDGSHIHAKFNDGDRSLKK